MEKEKITLRLLDGLSSEEEKNLLVVNDLQQARRIVRKIKKQFEKPLSDSGEEGFNIIP